MAESEIRSDERRKCVEEIRAYAARWLDPYDRWLIGLQSALEHIERPLLKDEVK